MFFFLFEINNKEEEKEYVNLLSLTHMYTLKNDLSKIE